jgi:hypothetical protein
MIFILLFELIFIKKQQYIRLPLPKNLAILGVIRFFCIRPEKLKCSQTFGKQSAKTNGEKNQR